jgi:hypothetical protein
MAKKTKTQIERLVNRLLTGKRLTRIDAFERFGVQRLSARIHELRNSGLIIETEKVKKSGKLVVAYKFLGYSK